MARTFPEAKKNQSVSKEKFVYVPLHFTQAESQEAILRWNHKANKLQQPPSLKLVKATEQISDTDLEVNAIDYTVSKLRSSSL